MKRLRFGVAHKTSRLVLDAERHVEATEWMALDLGSVFGKLEVFSKLS